MERIVSEKIESHHYRADACIVWCFDDRFSGLLERFIAARGWKHTDLIKIAGGAKGLASPGNKAEREYLLDQISKSIKLHQPPLIALMVHADCGAYGLEFKSAQDEQNFYTGELEKAATEVEKSIKASAPDIRVEKYMADFAGLVKI